MPTDRRSLIEARQPDPPGRPEPGGSGLYRVAADGYVTDLLNRQRIPFELITGHGMYA